MSAQEFSQVAAEQLQDLYDGDDPDLYDAVADAVDWILDYTDRALAQSGTLSTGSGEMRRYLPVVGHPWRVYFSYPPPNVEAILPYPL